MMRWLTAAAIATAVVIAGIGVMWWLWGKDESSDYATFWTPVVGSYAKLRQTDETLWNSDWTMNCTVVSVNSTTVMRREVWYTEFGGEYVNVTWPAPPNLTFPNGFDIAYDMGWPVEVTEVGVESIMTQWGERTCIHYQAQWSESFDGFVDNFWVHNGVMVRTEGPTEEGYQGGTWELVDTNIPEVTHQR